MKRRHPCPMDEVVALSKESSGPGRPKGMQMPAQAFVRGEMPAAQVKAERWEHVLTVCRGDFGSIVPPEPKDRPVTVASFRKLLSQRFGTVVLGAQVIHPTSGVVYSFRGCQFAFRHPSEMYKIQLLPEAPVTLATVAQLNSAQRTHTHTHSTDTTHTKRPTHTGLTQSRAGNALPAHASRLCLKISTGTVVCCYDCCLPRLCLTHTHLLGEPP